MAKALTPEDVYTLVRGKTPRGQELPPSWDEICDLTKGQDDSVAVDPTGLQDMVRRLISFVSETVSRDTNEAAQRQIQPFVQFMNELSSIAGFGPDSEMTISQLIGRIRNMPSDHPMVVLFAKESQEAVAENSGQLTLELHPNAANDGNLSANDDGKEPSQEIGQEKAGGEQTQGG